MSLHSEFRTWLKKLPPEATLNDKKSVVVALSGGADSLALTRAAIMLGLDVHAVVVDHQLQAGSDEVAAEAAQQARALGATSDRVITVTVDGEGEEPARRARYEALGHAAAELGHLPVLVAHTANDDAEGLILGLIRGSGTESLAGMRPVSFHHPVVDAGAAWLGRPLLNCTREMTVAECHQADLSFFTDPHNFSQKYTRSRIRTELLPEIERVAGRDITPNLSRTARMLREDADALSEQAGLFLPGLIRSEDYSLNCSGLRELSGALRRRIIKEWLTVAAGPLTSTHLERIDQLVVNYNGQGAVSVPWPTMDEHDPDVDNDVQHSRLCVARVKGYLSLVRQPR